MMIPASGTPHPRSSSKSAARSLAATLLGLALLFGGPSVVMAQEDMPDLQEVPALPPSPVTGQGPFAGLERQPWDRLEREHRIDGTFLWSRIVAGRGSSYTANMTWRQPLAQKQHLVEFEIPFRWVNYDYLPAELGVGDLRLQYYYMGRAQSEGDGALRGWAPSLNVVVPTGQEEKALGFGNWLVMPGVTTTHRLARDWKLQTTLSYAQSLGAVVPDGHPGIPIPSVKGLSQAAQDVSALRLEPTFVVEPRGWLIDWAEFTPDVFMNFAGQQRTAVTAKTTIGRVLTPNFSINAFAWFPIGDNNTLTTMWGFGISLWQ